MPRRETFRFRYYIESDGFSQRAADTSSAWMAIPETRRRSVSAKKAHKKNSESEDSKFFEKCYAGSSSVSDFFGERALRILFPCSCHFTQSELATQMDE